MRAPVCNRVDERIEQDARDRNEVVDSISPTNRWADRTDKPRVRTVLDVLCEP